MRPKVSSIVATSILLVTLACGGNAPSHSTSGDDTPAAQEASDSGDSTMAGDDDAPGDGDALAGDDLAGGDELAGEECAALPLPDFCDVTATTHPTAGELGADGPLEVVVETFQSSNPKAPRSVSVYRPVDTTNVPVVFFSHAYGAVDVVSYDLLLRGLASNGVAAVYAPYAASGIGVDNAERYAQLWTGFVEASIAYDDVFDLTRVGFAGHSFGGGATPEMARRGFVERGWGANGRFMFIMAPWYSWGSDYDTLPVDTRAVIQVYADDEVNDHQIAVQDIWDRLPVGLDAGWLLVRSDACGCGLNADHVVPTSASQLSGAGAKQNGLDTWGVQRRVAALARYAFTGDLDARAVAYGEDTFMGHWVGCGGRAVRPIEGGMTPRVTACHPFLYPVSARCDSADADYPCP